MSKSFKKCAFAFSIFAGLIFFLMAYSVAGVMDQTGQAWHENAGYLLGIFGMGVCGIYAAICIASLS